MHKRAAVIGGGIAGIQAALDLGYMGVETYLIERDPSIGGRMAQLDKTFPTNDCAMCIMSPKLVEVGSHPYVTIITNAEVMSVDGAYPRFKLRVLKHPRYVDEEKCTGCGVCMRKCPTKIPDPYNKNLTTAKCIRIPFPQAVPAVAVIDATHCLYFQKGKCRICEKFCDAKAIDYTQQQQLINLEVGAIVVASGSQEFDARCKGEYGYGVFPNVVTSIEFERILSASGPTAGHVTRPSDHKEPRRIAFVQCVGSRDIKQGNEHCSAICCMQAAKHATIVREHLPEASGTIFYMDIRSYGKGFDRFVERARDEHRTRLVCGRIASLEEDPRTDNVFVHYITQDGNICREEFDLVVLSVGLEPSASSTKTVQRLGAVTDSRGFLDIGDFAPVDSSRPGIFACGSISGPKDIPESVMEASGAASAAAATLGELPAREIHVDYPEEKDLRGQPPRIGVFVCRCGINIASTVDVPGVVDYAMGLHRVKHAQELLFSCSQDSQKAIGAVIEEKNLNRIVVCACTPRTHEPLFQKTIREAGLNPYLFEFANIREQCSWVHQKEPEKATTKAKDLLRNAVAKVISAEPLYRKSLDVNRAALVIGAGLAGITAALDLTRQGYQVHLVEKEPEPGGNLRHVLTTLQGNPTRPLLVELEKKIRENDRIRLYLDSRIHDITGYVGNFKTTLRSRSGDETVVEHGVVIVAAGGEEYQPDEYLYGRDERVVTQRRLEELLDEVTTDDATQHPSPLSNLKSVTMIQCVGSRDDKHPYCSRVCCSTAVKNAIRLKELRPDVSVYVLFRDVRTYGLREHFYRAAREKGVLFIRYNEYEKPTVMHDGNTLRLKVNDSLLGSTISLKPDLVVLSTGIVANADNKALSQFLKVPLDGDGFFLEAHVKLRPVDFATDGVFVCGLAHYPKDINETIAQARAAAGRAATVLSRDRIEAEGKVSSVREDRCSGCGACVAVCPYNAVELDASSGRATVNEALCKGCGACAATCRAAAIDLRGFRNEQILNALAAL
ncbi:MAG: CoB--CoM heterodisulfide reductase iron-sulfur subunit A family protein [Chitinispirillaceae bacterium]|nr:CoB--CoM heterodisulfide reductase iron-sulfur subunit A family protein [Chitinispirillaceae bacterium]